MRLDRKAKLVVLAGAATASVFAFLGVRAMYGPSSVDIEASAQAMPSAPQPQFLLAATTRAIRTGETITADMFRSSTSSALDHPGVASTSEILGKVAARDIAANTLIPRDALTPEARLAIRVPVGMRAISIETTDEIAVAGLIRPGDRVDVQVVYPGEDALSGARGEARSRAASLLQMVEVLAVGVVVLGQPSASGNFDAPPPPARTVTLALAPDQVSTLSLARNTGALYLSLRNPNDQDFADGWLADADPAPASYAAPPRRRYAPAPKKAVAAAPAKASPRAIELNIGGRKQTIYSGDDK